MKRPAVFFDRDNTLIVSDGYLGDPNGVVLMDGAPDAIAKVRQYGFKVVTVSNQSGVARGMFDEAAVQRVNTRMDELLKVANPRAVIERHEYCPYHPEAPLEQYRQDSPLRKPKAGMLLQAADQLNLDLSKSWLVGDAPRDVEAGKAAGCRTILFTPPGVAASPAAAEAAGDVEPDFRVSSLKEAVEIIGREAFKKFATAAPPAPTAAVAAPAKPVMLSVPAARAAAVEPDEHGDVIESANATSAKLEHLTAPTAVEEDEPEPEEALPIEPPPKVESPKVESPKVEPRVERPAMPAAPAPKPPETARPAPAQPIQAPATPPVNLAKVEQLLEQLLLELKRRREQPTSDFSVSKLMAGIVQVLAIAAMVMSFILRENQTTFLQLIAFALTLQTMTIALLIMGRQR